MTEAPIEFIVRLRGGSESAAEAKRIETAVRNMGGQIKRSGEEASKASGKTSHYASSLKRMAVGLGLAGAGFVAYQKGKQAIEFTTELARSSEVLSKATGMSVQESSKLTAVASALGVGNTKLAQVFTKVGAATVKQVESTGKHITAFDRLGISQDFAKKHMNDTAGILDAITHSFVAHHIPALERSKLLTELFGKSWLPLGRIFLDGETNFKKLTGLAKEFGLELSTTGADGIEKLKMQQEEYTLSTMGLKVAFTRVVAGPLGAMLQGFAKLTVFAKQGKWGRFNKEVERIAKQFETLAEKVLPKMAEGFARVAPAVLRAFWHGFTKANLGGQLLLAGVLASKFGLTGAIFGGIGKNLGKSVAGGLASQEAAAGASGTTLGGFFGRAFMAAAAGYLIYDKLLKGSPTEPEPLGELFDPFTGDKNKREKAEDRAAAAERNAVLKHQHGHERAHERKLQRQFRKAEHEGPIGKAKLQGQQEAEQEARRFRIPGAASGGLISRAGLAMVGEHGPELVHLPSGAGVQPLAPGSLVDNRPIKIDVSGRELARIQRRETMQSQAAGA